LTIADRIKRVQRFVPQVSIIIPCYNEEASIGLLLDALYKQTFPLHEMEVIIADGMSSDGTRAEITSWSAANSGLSVIVIDNFKRAIPSGVNRAIEVAEGIYIVRMDAHSIPNKDYVERSVTALQEGRGDNVGGMWKIIPGGVSIVARSIAAAATHPLGVGGVQYRVGGEPQAVDTVPFGAFKKDLVDRIGYFNEALLSNEDYEYNARIRETGGIIWFDPAIQSKYIARASFRDLSMQYWRYGYWKFQMLCRYPSTIRIRQALPPLLVLSFFCLGLFSFWFVWARWLLMLEFFIYVISTLIAGLQVAKKQSCWQFVFGVPAAIMVMHFSWGSAFLWSLVETLVLRIGKGR
jgi:glycosyltransferase involved in cell wall biosynthesis